MKKLLVLFIVALISFQIADAQRKKSSFFTDETRDEMGWNAGQIYLGPVLGVGWYGAVLGADGEYAITDKKWLAFGAGGTIAYHTGYTTDYPGWDYYNGFRSYSVHYFPITIQAFASWHLFPHKKFDVFARLGFGYNIWMTTTTGNTPQGWDGWDHSSGLGFNEQVGIRWYLSKNFSLKAILGDPITLGVGCDFIFGE